jgi:hypothetical protein
MDYYREVMTDDPFRRSERDRPGESADEPDKGDLFGLRQRPRHLRVLLDRDSLDEPTSEEELETQRVFAALLYRREPVDALFVDMSKVNDPDDESDQTPNVVHLRDYTANKGWASYPGPQYGYRIHFGGRGKTKKTVGNISPQPQLFQNWAGFAEDGGAAKLAEISAEDISRHVLLTQLGRKVADIVVSESAVARRTDVPANHEANVFTCAHAIPIIAHYLRTQQIYLMNPVTNEFAGNRQVWYHSAVYAMATGVQYWEAKTAYGLHREYMTDCSEMIGRLIRALKAWDDLRFHLGALQTMDSYDDVADCVDRVLWSLCGAVDVIARSLHRALQLQGTERNAKFHGDWYKLHFRPNYAQAAGIANVDAAQAALSTIFKLRNTIHSHSLRAVGALKEPARYVGKDHGRVQLLIPHDVYNEIDVSQRARWGFEEIAPGTALPAAADLATVATSAVDAVFSFLDQLGWMTSFEGIQGKDDVLKLDVSTVLKDGRRMAAMIRWMIGFTATESQALGFPYDTE